MACASGRFHRGGERRDRAPAHGELPLVHDERNGALHPRREVILRATVTIPNGDHRAGADCVVVMLEGHNVPVRLSVDKVQKTGRFERDARYFLEPAD
jgi:hypothetical protein